LFAALVFSLRLSFGFDDKVLGAVGESTFLDQAFDRPFDFAFFVKQLKFLGNRFGFKWLIVVAFFLSSIFLSYEKFRVAVSKLLPRFATWDRHLIPRLMPNDQ